MTDWAPLTKSPNWASQQHQRVRVGHRVAVLEAERGELRQRRVVGQEPALLGGQVAQRVVLLAGLAVDQHRVPLHERAAPGVLAGQPHQPAVHQHRPERDQLARTPSRCRPRGTSCSRFCSTGFTRGCTVNPSGSSTCASPMRWSTSSGTEVSRSGGMPLLVLHRRATARRRALQLADLVEHVLQLVGEVAQRVLGVLEGDVAAADQRLGVDLADAALGVDDVVHRGLGHRGVVALVVARGGGSRPCR